jgi:hypothetical protein
MKGGWDLRILYAMNCGGNNKAAFYVQYWQQIKLKSLAKGYN